MTSTFSDRRLAGKSGFGYNINTHIIEEDPWLGEGGLLLIGSYARGVFYVSVHVP
jgi:hypothetical protein